MKPMTFKVIVKKCAVSEKRKKQEDYEEVLKVGTLTLEFDGDSVNAGDICDFINGEYVLLGMADSQTRLAGFGEPA